ncbi:MAG: sigma-70 family RNA polymerase sigma factor [Planctomycetota bacterium]
MMQPWPDTRDTILARLYNADDKQAWEEFVQIYEPLIIRVATRLGLQDADARDVSQRVLLAVAGEAGNWKQGNHGGRFRGWLKRCATNASLNLLQRDDRHRASADTGSWALLQSAEAPPEMTDLWDEEYRLELFRLAAARVQSRFATDSWECFHRTAVLNESYEHVAQSMEKSMGAIYALRSRIMASIRREVQRLRARDAFSGEP